MLIFWVALVEKKCIEIDMFFNFFVWIKIQVLVKPNILITFWVNSGVYFLNRCYIDGFWVIWFIWVGSVQALIIDYRLQLIFEYLALKIYDCKVIIIMTQKLKYIETYH